MDFSRTSKHSVALFKISERRTNQPKQTLQMPLKQQLVHPRKTRVPLMMTKKRSAKCKLTREFL